MPCTLLPLYHLKSCHSKLHVLCQHELFHPKLTLNYETAFPMVTIVQCSPASQLHDNIRIKISDHMKGSAVHVHGSQMATNQKIHENEAPRCIQHYNSKVSNSLISLKRFCSIAIMVLSMLTLIIDIIAYVTYMFHPKVLQCSLESWYKSEC